MSLLAEDKITSVQSGQEEQLPSIVDAAPPPVSEIIRHTGAQNRIDPVLYMQNMAAGNFTWSVNDPKGKLLFYAPVHPEAINAILGHVSKTYTYWSGDVDYETKLAGTALQSGQIDLVELPPSVHPTSLAGTQDYMAYNWVGIDAKHQGMVGFTVRDVRQGAFHYLDQKMDKFTENQVGGYFAIYVGIPLNTTSTGTQQIAVQVWAKPSSNFRLTKLRIPRNEEYIGQAISDDLAQALNWHTKPSELAPLDAANFQAIDKIVLGSNTLKVWDYLSANHYDLEGTRFKATSKFNASNYGIMVGLVTSWRNSGDDNTDISASAVLKEAAGLHSDTAVILISSPDGKVIYHSVSVGYESKSRKVTLTFNVKDQTKANPRDWKEKMVYIWPNPLVGTTWKTEQDDEKITLPTDEGFVRFETEGAHSKSLQTYSMARLFSTGRFKSWIPEGMCAHFTVQDVVENLPVSAVKLWKEGFLTCAPKKDEVDFDIHGIKLIFTGFVPRTSPPQRTSEMARNALLLTAAKRSSKS